MIFIGVIAVWEKGVVRQYLTVRWWKPKQDNAVWYLLRSSKVYQSLVVL